MLQVEQFLHLSYAYINDCIKASAKYHKKKAKNAAVKSTGKVSSITPLHRSTGVFHKVFGRGKVLSTDPSGIMTVLFDGKTARFLYPGAVSKGYLSLAH